jgi:hypothetical protein
MRKDSPKARGNFRVRQGDVRGGEALFAAVCEGVVVKRLRDPYRPGERQRGEDEEPGDGALRGGARRRREAAARRRGRRAVAPDARERSFPTSSLDGPTIGGGIGMRRFVSALCSTTLGASHARSGRRRNLRSSETTSTGGLVSDGEAAVSASRRSAGRRSAGRRSAGRRRPVGARLVVRATVG